MNRPFDDLTQHRVSLEAQAVLAILARSAAGEWFWVSSEVVSAEIDQILDLDRRTRVHMALNDAQEIVPIRESDVARARELEGLGFRPFDALHLACVESAGADVLLTTDDRFLRMAHRLAGQVHVRVANPLLWLEEVTRA